MGAASGTFGVVRDVAADAPTGDGAVSVKRTGFKVRIDQRERTEGRVGLGWELEWGPALELVSASVSERA